ncbi:MAG: hypothetical protein BGO95_04065 [Micrococcales bacterium 73-13]|nr:MAG: hypothetical protein BGO95_04065 [Micrococcales bacterium 73-13]
MKEHPSRGLVDRFGGRYQAYIATAQGPGDVAIVVAVPRQPIEFMDDDVVDVVVVEVFEHCVQVVTSRRRAT